MDYGTRSGKILSLGMPKAPQGKPKDTKKPKLGDALGRHPLFRLHLSVTLLGTIFLFTNMICVLLGASCIICVFVYYYTTIILVVHTYLREPKLRCDLLELLSILHLNLLSYGIALVLHLYIFDHGVI